MYIYLFFLPYQYLAGKTKYIKDLIYFNHFIRKIDMKNQV